VVDLEEMIGVREGSGKIKSPVAMSSCRRKLPRSPYPADVPKCAPPLSTSCASSSTTLLNAHEPRSVDD
jgi:hypothetical protein